jgi:CBS domain-containing protein
VAAAVVVDGDRVCGVVTKHDITIRLAAEEGDPGLTFLRALCRPDIVTVAPTAPIGSAANLVRERSAEWVVVVDNHLPVGILSAADLTNLPNILRVSTGTS